MGRARLDKTVREALQERGLPTNPGPGGMKAMEHIERFWALPPTERYNFMIDLQLLPRGFTVHNDVKTYEACFLRAARTPGKIEEIQALLETRAPKH